MNETRNATYKRLSHLASSVGLDESEIYSLLEISDKPGEDGGLNTGNKVTDDLKQLVKVRTSAPNKQHNRFFVGVRGEGL